MNGALSNQLGGVTITFPTPGVYRIEISGTFTSIQFNNTGDRQKILTIEQWGDLAWTSFRWGFYGCSNLTIPATDAPNLSNGPNMQQMFQGASSFNQPINHWDVSNVTDMRAMFQFATSFNQPLNNWNTSNVFTMTAMFAGTPFNQDISNWDVSNVIAMPRMFDGATNFNINLSNWNVSAVTSMASMFANTNVFNQNIGSWDVSNVTDMSGMFWNAIAFNQDIGAWDVGNVLEMGSLFPTQGGMFEGAISFNQDIGGWNVENVVNMNRMFHSASIFDQDLGSWNVGSVINMSCMFCGATSFNQDISTWDVSNVQNMTSMFSNTTSFNQDLSSWNVSSVTSMSHMFIQASSFNQDLGEWNVQSVTDMTNMLSNSGLSTANYDATLIGWAAQTIQPNVTLGATGLTYCNSEVARNTLINAPNNWTITGDGFICPQANIEVINQGTGTPSGSNVQFAKTGVGVDQLKELEITNTGNATLVVTDIQVTGDFALASALPPPINPGNTELLSIRFSPTGLGERTGTLTILSNGDIPVYTLTLIGEGDAEPEVYNVVTTNPNSKHDFLNIRNITLFPNNIITIYDRWGNKVFEKTDYDNVNGTFIGISDDGKELPEGTYYYVLDKNNGSKRITGFIMLKR